MKKHQRLRNLTCALFVVLAVACAVAAIMPRGSVTVGGEFVRPHGPAALSAISHQADDRYWTVDDESGRLLLVRIPLDSVSGAPKGWEVISRFTIPGASDLEGVAADPLSPTVVWVADERSLQIVGFDTVSNRVVQVVTLPTFSGDTAKNRGIESLAMAPDGLQLWTCLEGPLEADGAFVRLLRFARGGAGEAWRLDGVWAVPFEWRDQKFKKVSLWTSVADLAVLADGRLIMLELAKTKVKKVRTGQIVLSEIEVAGATNVSTAALPAKGGFQPAVKRRFYLQNTGLALYEGLAEGPHLADGTATLLLVSDAEKGGERRILSLRIDRLASGR